ncbi:MAG: hypothetical protein IKU37_06665 [Candidatus Gastranaerophilales bacterium]|nr:hypothetical protein [Candidatus Gastranaerophilales bacterium]
MLEAYEHYNEVYCFFAAKEGDESLERRNKIIAKIDEFAQVARQIEAFNLKKLEYEKNEQVVAKYVALNHELEKQIRGLQSANAQILPSGEFSEDELKSWERYLYCQHLLDAVKKATMVRDYKKFAISASDAKEVFNYANTALVSEIATLKEVPAVKYKLNLEDLEQKQAQLERNKEYLENAQRQIDEHAALREEILKGCNGKTMDDALKEWQRLQEELNIIDGIKLIASKKEKLSSARRKYEANEKVLKQLENNDGMTNLDFNSLFKELCFDVD